MEAEGSRKQVRPFREVYKLTKVKRLKHIIAEQNSEIHRITFRRGIETHTQPNRLRGRPKYKWADRAIIDIWEEIQKHIATYRNIPLNLEDDTITKTIIQYAMETRKL